MQTKQKDRAHGIKRQKKKPDLFIMAILYPVVVSSTLRRKAF